MDEMTEWLKLSDAQRRGMIEQVEYIEGIQTQATEKDWWVTLTLKALFTCKYREHLIFKGGTSLSKCWKLIERFSEDIDIALAPEAFDMRYEENATPTSVKRLKKAGCEFTSTKLKAELEKRFAEMGVPAGMIRVEAAAVREDMPDTDPQTLFVHYSTLFEPNEYLPNVVRIEVSVRSLKEPNAIASVQSILGTAVRFGQIYKETPFEVVAVAPERTFLEKVFLLHEEFQKPDATKIKSNRMSRHLYDLERMMDSEAGVLALTDKALYTTIIKHRATYSRLKGIDYALHERGTLSFLPPETLIEAYGKDYTTMRGVMIYGEAISYEELLKRLGELLQRFKAGS